MKRKMVTFVQSLLIVFMCYGCAQHRLVRRELSDATNKPPVENCQTLQKKIQIVATSALVGMLGGMIIGAIQEAAETPKGPHDDIPANAFDKIIRDGIIGLGIGVGVGVLIVTVQAGQNNEAEENIPTH
jgi:hypothetical protein